MGAVPFISDPLQFDIKTKKHGILWLRVDDDNKSCYSVFARFVDPSMAPIELDGLNTWSGKWNHHLSGENHPFNAVSEVVQNLKFILN